jgi:Tol biopolymer transport system component
MTARAAFAGAFAAILVSGASGSTAARPPIFTGSGKIVFACAGCPQVPTRGELYTVSASGRGFRRLHTTPQSPYSPRWSPDGRSLAFYADSSLLLLRASPPGRAVRLTRHCDLCDRDPAWSPDGRTIIFTREGLLYTIRAARGSRPRALKMRRRSSIESSDWSSDGRRIAFHDASGLYVVRNDGRRPRRVVRGRMPRWSPDGKWIAFIGAVDTAHALMVIRPDGTGRRVIARPPSLHSGVNPAWSPDGRQLLFVVNREFEPGQSGREFRVVSLATRRLWRIEIPQLQRYVGADINGLDWTR